MLYSLILVAVSLLLFHSTPQNYSLPFCSLCLGVFGLDCFLLYKMRTKGEGIVNFNTFFLLAFFLVSYAYPVFIYSTGVTDFIDNKGLIAPSSINPCTALCSIAISSYSLGYCYLKYRNKKRKRPLNFDYNYYREISRKNSFFYDASAFAVIIILFLFFTVKQAVEIEVSYAPFVFILFLICTIIALLSKTMQINKSEKSLKAFWEKNRKVLLISTGVMLVYIIIGDRLIIVDLALIIIGIYSIFFKRVRTIRFVLLVVMGFVLMSLLVWTRGSSGSLRKAGVEGFLAESNQIIGEQEAGIWGYTVDLSGRFTELSYGYQMTETMGNVYPLKIIATLFYPIPFVPNIVSNAVLGVPTSQTSAGYFIARDSDTHAGTHCVIDIYMPWGVPGVLFFFALFGFVVCYFDKNKYTSFYCSVGYVVLIYQSVFIARGTIFDIYRSLVWAMVIIYLYNKSKTVRNVR